MSLQREELSAVEKATEDIEQLTLTVTVSSG